MISRREFLSSAFGIALVSEFAQHAAFICQRSDRLHRKTYAAESLCRGVSLARTLRLDHDAEKASGRTGQEPSSRASDRL
jgi:hypothetical protein